VETAIAVDLVVFVTLAVKANDLVLKNVFTLPDNATDRFKTGL
jgi:hypothetical protein